MIKRADNQTILRFENGDINIVRGILLEEEIGWLAFREQKPREIGLNNGDKPSLEMLKALKEDIQNGIGIRRILTHEQFEVNCYKVKEEIC